jgi:hypothetical protein
MSDSNPNHRGHSADVRMTLYLEGRALPISHLGPDFLIVKTPIDHPPTDAEIELVIDGLAKRWPVRLHKGMSAADRETRISPCRAAPGSTAD